jgi:hypothetical protein
MLATGHLFTRIQPGDLPQFGNQLFSPLQGAVYLVHHPQGLAVHRISQLRFECRGLENWRQFAVR